MGEVLSKFVAFRFKAFVAAFLVGMLPVAVKAVEAGTGFDIPGAWEVSWANLLQAWLVGMGVNYAENVKV